MLRMPSLDGKQLITKPNDPVKKIVTSINYTTLFHNTLRKKTDTYEQVLLNHAEFGSFQKPLREEKYLHKKFQKNTR